MKRVTFRYRDNLSNWEWRTQHCTIESIEECIRIYGLNGSDVEWEIVKVEDDDNTL